MKKSVLSLSIAAMLGGLGFSGAASAGLAYEAEAVGPAANASATATSFNSVLTATNASTLAVNPSGVGHVLVTPYFSVQEGNGTLLSIVNTDTVNGKAVKVRFRGAANSDDLLDFTVLLSPGDVWVANASKDAKTGLAQIYTPDNSCTLPRSALINVAKFKTDRVYGADDAAKAGETLEGYVEIFNMADIPPNLPNDANGAVADDGTKAAPNPLYTAIKHTSAGTNPCSVATSDAGLPAAVSKLLSDPVIGANGTAAEKAANRTALLKHGLWAPSTGLIGTWTILNVAGASVAWSGNMAAIEARTTAGAAARGRVVFSPQSDSAVAATAINDLTADPLLRNGGTAPNTAKISAAQYDLPDMSTPYLIGTAYADNPAAADAAAPAANLQPLRQANLLSKSLAAQNVINEYVTEPSISAATDWVFSMPTRRYAVAVNYPAIAKGVSPLVFNTSAITQTAETLATPLSDYFSSLNVKMGTGGKSGNPEYQVCAEPGGAVTAYDREEATAAGEFVISPGTTKKVVFCGETTVLSFNASTALQAKLSSKGIDTGFKNGWLNINTRGLGEGTTANPYKGLPILGHSFVKMTGPVVAGKSTNFSITQPHRFR